MKGVPAKVALLPELTEFDASNVLNDLWTVEDDGVSTDETLLVVRFEGNVAIHNGYLDGK